MIQKILLSAIALSAASLVAFFILTGARNAAALSLLVGLAWIVLEWLDKDWVASPAMVSLFVLAVFGAVPERYAPLCLLAAVLALSAWDLSRFLHRLKSFDTQLDVSWSSEARRHVRRLFFVNGVGFLLALIAINLRWAGPFYPVFLLALIVLVGLFALVIRLSRLTQ